MKRIYSITLGAALTVLAAPNSGAQWNVARFDTDRSRVYTTLGLDPAVITSVGYGRVVSVLGRNIQFTGDVGVATAELDTRDFRGRLGAQGSIARWGSLHLTGTATFIARGTENSIYRGFNFGADFTGSLGVYRSSWFAAGEFGKDKAVITHVTHTDYYREHFYPDAKDGWYLDAGGRIHYGVAAGRSLGRTDVTGRFGFQRSENFNALSSPMYASIGVGFRY